MTNYKRCSSHETTAIPSVLLYLLKWLVKSDSCGRVVDDINVVLQKRLLIVLQTEAFLSNVATDCVNF